MSKKRSGVDADRQRQQYTREFKLEAVRLLELGQKSPTQIAHELGIRRNQLYRWQKDAQDKATEAFPGRGRKSLEKRGELERLKSELKQVTEERDILKKAAAYFAKELK